MTRIEWTGETWNPVVGCSVVSPGCTNCYAMKMARRLELMSATQFRHYAGLTKLVNGNAVWTGTLKLAPDGIVQKPLRWTKPRTVFVNSMSDLFHDMVPDEWIDRVFAAMALTPQHTYQVLTKRPARMRRYFDDASAVSRQSLVAAMAGRLVEDGDTALHVISTGPWPLPNVWLGVSAERQQEADARIPDLLNTPAAVRFVSAEPLLGPIDFDDYHLHSPKLDWIIVGGESGTDARPMHPDWARSIRDQCETAGTPFFFKQWGAWAPGENVTRTGKKHSGRLLDGRTWSEMPALVSTGGAP